MRYIRPLWSLQPALPPDYTIVGNPAVAAAPNNCLYLAVGARIGESSQVVLVLACMDRFGAFLWCQPVPASLVPGAADVEDVALCAGASGVIYIAFSTTGAIPERFNMSDIPSFCVDCSLGPDRHDIVLARVNVGPAGITSVGWRVQDASINSCFGERKPVLAYDGTYDFVYLAWECNKNMYCGAPFNSGPNIAAACFSGADGTQRWLDVTQQLNGAGQNTNPAIACDNKGGLYIALEVTAPVDGAPAVSGTQIEILKYQTAAGGSVNNRVFVQSIRASGGSAVSPAIVADGVGGVFVACVTTGAVASASGTAIQDLAIVALNESGTVRWAQQAVYTTFTLPFSRAESPTLCLDQHRNLYVAILGRQADDGESLLFYKLYRDTGLPTQWTYDRADGSRCTAYGYAYTDAPYAVLPTAATPETYGKPLLCALDGTLVATGSVAAPTPALRITGFAQPLLYDFITAYEYVVNYKTICSCSGGGSGEGCKEC